jgi:hypothetical protein
MCFIIEGLGDMKRAVQGQGPPEKRILTPQALAVVSLFPFGGGMEPRGFGERDPDLRFELRLRRHGSSSRSLGQAFELFDFLPDFGQRFLVLFVK